jgi:hypothetical protein
LLSKQWSCSVSNIQQLIPLLAHHNNHSSKVQHVPVPQAKKQSWLLPYLQPWHSQLRFQEYKCSKPAAHTWYHRLKPNARDTNREVPTCSTLQRCCQL